MQSQRSCATVKVSNKLKCWNTMAMPSWRACWGFANLHRLAIKQHLTGIRLGAAVDNFHQG